MLRRFLLAIMLVCIAVAVLGCAADDPSIVFEGDLYSEIEGDADRRELRSHESRRSIFIEPSTDPDWDYTVAIDDKEYRIEGSPNSFRVEFPDGRTLTRNHGSSTSTGSAAPGTATSFEDWDRVDSIGKLVYGAASTEVERGAWTPSPAGFILVAMGLLLIFRPRWAFFLDLGWRVKDAEPSDLYLAVAKIGGWAMVIAGALLGFS